MSEVVAFNCFKLNCRQRVNLMPAGLMRGTTNPSVAAVKNTACCVQVDFRLHVAVVKL